MSKVIYNKDGSFRFALGEPRGRQPIDKEPLNTICKLADELMALRRGYSAEKDWDVARAHAITAELDRLSVLHAEQKVGVYEHSIFTPMRSMPKGQIAFFGGRSW